MAKGMLLGLLLVPTEALASTFWKEGARSPNDDHYALDG